MGGMLGKYHSEETKRKLSEANKGENNPHYGKHCSEKTKKKISDTLKGRRQTETQRKNHFQSGENHPMYGKHHSEEMKRRLGEALKGEKNYMYGKSLSEETKRKLSKAMKSRKQTEAQKRMQFQYGQPPPHGKSSACKKGHFVRSTWELAVADWLFDQGVDYEYEPERFCV